MTTQLRTRPFAVQRTLPDATGARSHGVGQRLERLAGVGSGVLVTMQQGSLAMGVGASLGTLFVGLSAGGIRGTERPATP